VVRFGSLYCWISSGLEGSGVSIAGVWRPRFTGTEGMSSLGPYDEGSGVVLRFGSLIYYTGSSGSVGATSSSLGGSSGTTGAGSAGISTGAASSAFATSISTISCGGYGSSLGGSGLAGSTAFSGALVGFCSAGLAAAFLAWAGVCFVSVF